MIGHDQFEVKYDEIKLTDQLREMNDKVIECRRVDNEWVFHYLTGRPRPNAMPAIQSKI